MNLLRANLDLTTFAKLKQIDDKGVFLMLPERSQLERSEWDRIENVVGNSVIRWISKSLGTAASIVHKNFRNSVLRPMTLPVAISSAANSVVVFPCRGLNTQHSIGNFIQ